MYGVVVCPRCKRPKGVNLEAKTATCSCGRRLRIQGLRVYFSTSDPREIPEAIGRLRAQMAGKPEEFDEVLQKSAGDGVPREDKGKPRDTRSRVLGILRKLEAEGGAFDLRQAEEALREAGITSRSVIEALLAESLIYEVDRGRYRVV